MSDEKNTETSQKQKSNPLTDIKPKEIPTMKHTFEFHGKKETKEKK